MFLSIIIPAYNASHSIADTLCSVLKLPENNTEVIVINDGSTDNTALILQEFCKQYTNLSFVTQVNQGVSVARNAGLQVAKGDYVWFVDADDIIDSDNASLLLDRMKNKSYDLIWFANLNIVNGKMEKSNNMPDYIKKDGNYNIEEWRKLYSGAGMLWQYWLRRERIMSCNIRFVEWAKWFEDADFLLKYTAHCRSCYITPTVLYHYVLNPSGAMRSSLLEDRHTCSVRLGISLLKECKAYDLSAKLFTESIISVSIAWCIREANFVNSKKLYLECLKSGVFPLRAHNVGLKKKLQITILNMNYSLYRLFCSFI